MITDDSDGIRLAVRVTVRAKRDQLTGPIAEADGRAALAIRLAAPPVDGAANAALVTFLAKELAVPRSAVTIVSGEKSRHKLVRITGITAGAASLRLESRAD